MGLSKRARAQARRQRIKGIQEAGGKNPDGSYVIDDRRAATIDAERRARQS